MLFPDPRPAALCIEQPIVRRIAEPPSHGGNRFKLGPASRGGVRANALPIGIRPRHRRPRPGCYRFKLGPASSGWVRANALAIGIRLRELRFRPQTRLAILPYAVS